MLDHAKPNVEKIHYIDAKLTGHAHKLVKLQSLCGSGFCLFSVRILAKPYHFGVNWPTTLCENKDGMRFFTLTFKCHCRYNKLLLRNSENGDIATHGYVLWCGQIVCIRPYSLNTTIAFYSVNEWSNFAVSVWLMACYATMLSHST